MLTYTEMTEQIRQESMPEGIQKGTSEARYNLARNMVAEGLAIETIVRITGLSEQDVRGLN